MKNLKIFNIVVTILLFLISCTSEQNSVEITCEQFSDKKHFTSNIKVMNNQSLFVSLCSNPTTGFQWAEKVHISNKNIIKQVRHNIISPKDSLPGTASKQEWTFKAINKGKSILELDYSRPWEGGEKKEWSLTIYVIVD